MALSASSSVDEVCAWLDSVRLSHLKDSAEESMVTGSQLLNANIHDIQQMFCLANISSQDSETLLQHVAAANGQQQYTVMDASSARQSRAISDAVLEDYTVLHDVNVPSTPAGRKKSTTSFASSIASKRTASASSRRESQSRPLRPTPSVGVTAADLADSAYCGWLTKRGEVVKNWKLRWVVLHKGSLYYFKGNTAQAARGQFSLNGYTASQEILSSKTHCFKLIKPGHKRVWIFSARSDKERDDWMQQITMEVKKYRDVGDAEDEDSEYSEDGFSSVEENESDFEYDDPYDDSINLEDASAPSKPPAAPKLPPRVSATSQIDQALARAMAPALPHRDVHSAPQPVTVPKATDVLESSWYFVGADRSQAELLLTKSGTFLLRQKTPDAQLVLSLRWLDRVRHYKVFSIAQKGYCLNSTDNAFFPTVAGLVRHYQTHNLPKSDCKLVTPFGQ
eukprot:m.356233 g.356233  ORF g.356233 m.356233 type:complete len:451 (-) comp17478_c0_seq1:397-1749(-)